MTPLNSYKEYFHDNLESLYLLIFGLQNKFPENPNDSRKKHPHYRECL